MGEMPSRKEKYFAWVMISLISFFFAEIISGSSMIISFAPGDLAIKLLWSLFITIPLYGLHTIVLAWVVYHFAKPRLYTLFFAGIIFALYEAYITKVLWVGWGSNTVWYFGGVAVVETAILLLFWHPFMSFIIPLFASESILTRSREILSALPRRLRWLFSSRKKTCTALLLFALLCGISQGGITPEPSPLYPIASELLAFVIFTPLLFIYRRAGLQKYAMRQLLPTTTELAALLVPLLLIYLVMGLGIRPEVLRSLLPQAIVWLMYAVAIILLYLSLRKSKRVDVASRDFPVRLSKKLYFTFFLILTLASAIVSLMPLRVWITVAFLFLGVAIGLATLMLAVRDILKKR
jgi:hypothetical protein